MQKIGGIHGLMEGYMDSLPWIVREIMWRIFHIIKRRAAKVSNSTGGRHNETNSCEEDASRLQS